MPIGYHYEANCCGETRTEAGLSWGAHRFRGECPNCGWLTDWHLTEKLAVDTWGDML